MKYNIADALTMLAAGGMVKNKKYDGVNKQEPQYIFSADFVVHFRPTMRHWDISHPNVDVALVTSAR